MRISFSVTYKDVFVLGWAIGWCLLASLVIGSVMEVEPQAAKMFGIVTAVWTIIAYPLWKWRNR